MNQILFIHVIIFCLLLNPTYITAQEFPNNKFGIHLAQAQDEDIDRAAELVNSNGGTWGYVTVVIQENDRDLNKWQGIFEKFRERKLVPIVRLATQPQGSNWRRPEKSEAKEWAQFLDKLHWVVEKRYVILFNEPNHATEWGGVVDPVSFGQVNEAFAKELKKADDDFFVMLGGMDASAPSNPPQYQDAGIFLQRTVDEIGVDDFNRIFDGLSSHSYPNPAFAGSPLGSGKGTVRTFEWELDLLQSLGIKTLPVFITETGWDGDALPREQVAENFRIAYHSIWLPDERVVAVTPFILNYQGEPFLKFSWVKPGNSGVYPEFELVQDIPKQSGRPSVIQSGRIMADLPSAIVAESNYHLQIVLENTGQAIWDDEEYSVRLEDILTSRYLVSPIHRVKPFEKRRLDIYFLTGSGTGTKETRFALYRDDEKIIESDPWSFEIVPLPTLEIGVNLFPKMNDQGEDFTLQVFDEYESLVFEKKDITIDEGRGSLAKVENIALGREYRIVILKDHYLPRQKYHTFERGENDIKFERLLPLDPDGDGAFTYKDIIPGFTIDQMKRWWPGR